MEELIHYVWKHKIFPLEGLTTTDGKKVEVVNPGLHNFDAGPDFFNAKVKVDGVMWVGNVEIHTNASDWFRHGHDHDKAYDSIILHVVGKADCEVRRSDGTSIPQVVLPVPQYVADNYQQLRSADITPRCGRVVSTLSPLVVHSWMSSLYVERLEQRTNQIVDRWCQCGKDWEQTLFITLARNFGFGKNGDAFERWAQSIPLAAVAKHRDNLLQVEAVFFGQAGLLNDNCPKSAPESRYYHSLQSEYKYLQKKFQTTTPLRPMDYTHWLFLRLRPQNFPHIRIAQLAMLYHEGRLNFSKIVEHANDFSASRFNHDIDKRIGQIGQLRMDFDGFNALFQTHVSDYWQTHYYFTNEKPEKDGKQERKMSHRLSKSSIDILLINTISPILFAYGRQKQIEHLTDTAIDIVEQISPETNRIIKDWAAFGVIPENAADSQGLIQLHNEYCIKRNCLRCRFGYEFIRNTPKLLFEEKETESGHEIG